MLKQVLQCHRLVLQNCNNFVPQQRIQKSFYSIPSLKSAIVEGNKDKAWQAFQTIRKNNTKTAPQMFAQAIKLFKSDVIRVEEVLQTMIQQQVPFDMDIIQATMESYLDARDFVMAERMIERAVPLLNGKEPTYLHALFLQGIVGTGDMKRAEEYFAKLTNQTVFVYNKLLDGYARKGDFTSLEQTIQKMKDKNVPLDSFSYNQLLFCMKKIRSAKQAEQVIQDMIKHKVQPDERAYGVLMEMYLNENQEEQAVEIFNSLVAKRKTVQTSTFGAFVEYFGHHHKLQQAEQYFELGIKSTQITKLHNSLYRSLISAYEHMHRFDKVDQICKRIENFEYNDFVLYSLIRAYSSAKQMSTAKALFEKCKTRFTPSSNTYQALVFGYVYDEQYSMAESVLYECKRSTPFMHTLIVRKADMETAKRVFNRSKKLFPKEEIVYTTMILRFVEIKQYDKVEDLFQQMKQEEIEPTADSWNCILAALTSANEEAMAEDLLTKYTPNEYSYVLLMQMYAALEEHTKIQQVMTEYKSKHVKLSSILYNIWLSSQNTACIKLNVAELEKEIKKYRMQTTLSIYGNLMLAWINQGELEKAETMYLKSRHPDLILHTIMMRAYGVSGHLDKAEQIFLQIKDQINGTVLSSMVTIYIHNNNIASATELLTKYKHLIDEHSIAPMIWHFAENNQAEKMESIIQWIRKAQIPFTEYMYTILMRQYTKLQIKDKVIAAYQECEALGLIPTSEMKLLLDKANNLVSVKLV